MSHILIFGDSITLGAWDEEGGWAGRLQQNMNKKAISSGLETAFLVHNLGVDGDTTEGLLERFDFEVKRRLSEDETIIIFAIGSNDSEFDNQTKKLRISSEDFKNNLEKLSNKAKDISSKIIFTGLLPIDESKVDPIPWLPEISYKNKYIRQYDDIIKSVCQENKIDFIELFEKFEKMDYKKLLEDGVHPNSEGHKIIFETVKEFLVSKKII